MMPRRRFEVISVEDLMAQAQPFRDKTRTGSSLGMPVKLFLETFVPGGVLSDTQKRKLQDGVCPNVTLVEEGKTDILGAPSRENNPDPFRLAFRCNHAVVFQLIVSHSSDGTEYLRILRTTRTSVHATVKFKSRTTPWMVQFTMRFTALFGFRQDKIPIPRVKGPCVATKDIARCRIALDGQWIDRRDALEFAVAGQKIIGGNLGQETSSFGDYYVGLNTKTNDVVLVEGVWIRRGKGKGKGRGRFRHRMTVRDVRPPPTYDPNGFDAIFIAAAGATSALAIAHHPPYNLVHGDVGVHTIVGKGLRVGSVVDFEDGKSKKSEEESSWTKELNHVMSTLMREWRVHGRMREDGIGISSLPVD